MIGLDLGEIESEAFWVEFLRSLRAPGLQGVRLAVSDQHEGLKHAIERVLACPWQRCTGALRQEHAPALPTLTAWSRLPEPVKSIETLGRRI